MASVYRIYDIFWQKIFENGNIFGNIDISLKNGNFVTI